MSDPRLDPKPSRRRFVAEHLERLRKESEVSLRELCRRTGKEPEFFDALAEERVPLTFEDFVDIVRALDCDPADVLDAIIYQRPWLKSW